jgi:hypothetical protein
LFIYCGQRESHDQVISREVLHDLANFGDLPLPEAVIRGHKRPRGDDNYDNSAAPAAVPSVAAAGLSPGDTSLTNGQRNIAGSRRVSLYQTPECSPSLSDGPTVFSPSMDFVLPVHSDELGRLPVFPAQSHSQLGTTQAATIPTTTAPAAPVTYTDVWSQFDMTPSVFEASSSSSLVDGSAPTELRTMGPPPPPPGASPVSSFVGQPTAFQAPDYSAFSSNITNAAPPIVGGLETSSAAFDLRPALIHNDVAGPDPSGDMLAMWLTAPEGFE